MEVIWIKSLTLLSGPRFVQNKRNGGLEVRDLSILNRALLCKWIWRFANENNALWRNVICWKFGEERGGWVTCVFRGASGTSV